MSARAILAGAAGAIQQVGSVIALCTATRLWNAMLQREGPWLCMTMSCITFDVPVAMLYSSASGNTVRHRPPTWKALAFVITLQLCSDVAAHCCSLSSN